MLLALARAPGFSSAQAALGTLQGPPIAPASNNVSKGGLSSDAVTYVAVFAVIFGGGALVLLLRYWWARSRAAKGGLIVRRVMSRRDPTLRGGIPASAVCDIFLVDVDYEALMASIFGPFERSGQCPVCLEQPMAPGEPCVRFCSQGHTLCRGCAVDTLRANLRSGEPLKCPTPDPGQRCLLLLDTVADLTQGGSHHLPGGAAGESSNCLSVAEAALLRTHMVRDMHAHPADWVVGPCPAGCQADYAVPLALARRGGAVVCHACTHRICPRCNVKWTDRLLPGRPETHEGRTCAEVARLKASLQSLSPAEMAAAGIKKCPGCGMGIQKNEGCHHMVCGQHTHGTTGIRGGCAREFCWDCLEDMGPTSGIVVQGVHMHKRECRWWRSRNW